MGYQLLTTRAQAFFILSLFVVLLFIATSTIFSANVEVKLKGTWKQTFLSQEASEFFGESSNEKFWKFVQKFNGEIPSNGIATQKDEYDLILRVSNELSNSKDDLSMLQYALSTRYYSPKVEFFNQEAKHALKSGNFISQEFPNNLIVVLKNGQDNIYMFESISKGLEQLLTSSGHASDFLLKTNQSSVANILPFDHIHPSCHFSAASSNGVVILYANMLSESFKATHSFISSKCEEYKFTYVFRHFNSKSFGIERKDSLTNKHSDQLLSLQGYGVELQIKNMEYKQMDDSILKYQRQQEEKQKQAKPSGEELDEIEGVIFSKLIEKHPHFSSELTSFREYLINEQQNSTLLLFGSDNNLKKWELKDMGIQASQIIMKSSPEDAIATIQQMSQDFPTISSSLSKVSVTNNHFQGEVKHNRETIGEGTNLLQVNGIKLDMEKTTAFNFLDMIRRELHLKQSLHSNYHLSDEVISSLLAKSSQSSEQRVNLLNKFDDSEIMYINNIESDARYGQFPRHLDSMLLPTYFGQMRFIRRNIFVAILIVDPTTKQGLDAISAIFQTYNRGWPVRFGFLFVPSALEEAKQYLNYKQNIKTTLVDVSVQGSSSTIEASKKFEFKFTSTGAKMLHILEYIKEKRGKDAAFQFLMRLSRNENELTESQIKEAFKMYTSQELSYEEVQESNHYHQTVGNIIRKSIDYFGGYPREIMPALLLNGRMFKNLQNSVDQMLMSSMQTEHSYILSLIREKKLQDTDRNLQDVIMKESNTFEAYHPKIFTKKQETNFISMNLFDDPIVNRMHFLHSPSSESIQKSLTHLLFVDLDKISGIRVLYQAIVHLLNKKENHHSRVAVIHNGKLPCHKLLSSLIHAASNNPSNSLSQLSESLQTVLSQARDDGEIRPTLEQFLTSSKAKYEKYTEDNSKERHTNLLKYISKLGENLLGKNHIVTNGRLITLDDEEILFANDFDLLEQYELNERVNAVVEAIESNSFDGVDPELITSEWRSSIIFGTCSALYQASSNSKVERSPVDMSALKTQHCSLRFNSDSASLPVIAIINPLSVGAQKVSSYLSVLVNHFKFPTTVILNPVIDNTEIPLKSWYRFVLDPVLHFDNSGNIVDPHAFFKQLPTKHILTMNMDVPETWLIESTYAIDDLDNINLQFYNSEDRHTLKARYQLENIIVTGGCFDHTYSLSPPRGLQLVLREDIETSNKQDTLVMANYGYFQLKANPNEFILSLSPKHDRIYDILDTTADDAISSQKNRIHVTSFDGVSLEIHVKKKPGKEKVDILEDNGSDSSIWSKLFSGGSNGDEAENEEDDSKTINIFSVASGHMYERLLKIMISSVIKNTKRSPVKFWFIKNFLSPQFKMTLPLIAKRMGFKYEFVTYKWPTWLNKQTQKQRIIWAYKVLFLDVLFPLKVHKIIFVDADQVTRADLTELFHETDMQGKPLAYTPFCSSRKEMDGYRFWKQGYWVNHLRGLPYHISALYVVDIDRFRKMYAGDQLRMFYDNLSKDPNSLANLDQDLPNYAQHVVPIRSLDQHWLWCETWCSDEEKKHAKTIDLCNNPMTKEHKLESARRIIPEWSEYDEQVKRIEEELREQGLISF